MPAERDPRGEDRSLITGLGMVYVVVGTVVVFFVGIFAVAWFVL